ncbi:MAG: GatB/YqeY domain-containing protein [Anaerolineae bacterium]|nr:GatB/YqeY domain-containing protein [Anaerolineae bacterium]NIN98647.1 GatB/YqeY domain-containing protein [Anaerolineae bacterium]NIQ81534.1 GatB/YqeY domain-containing protein [Anaerolineae bacterium]
MGLKQRLENDLKEALRAKDERRKTTLRLTLAAIKNAEIDKGRQLNENELTAVISQQAKQRRESAAEFAKGGRDDLVSQEEEELKVLMEYLPPQLSEEEIRSRAHEVIDEVGATSPAQMGEVMRVLMPELKGKADGQVVSTIVRGILSEMG